jgi:hypothetical protein
VPVPPPVPASSRYPLAIRDFVTYLDQPGGAGRYLIVQNSDGTTTTIDLTLDSAVVTKDVQTEIVSLEQTIGTKPFMTPGASTVGASIQYLYNYMADRTHNHRHFMSKSLTADDHPQYMPVNGSRAFRAPVTAPGAKTANELINLSQAKIAGLTYTQVQATINNTLAAQKLVPGEHNITGPDNRRWKMAGGVAQGYTDGNGNLWVDLSPAKFNGILSFNYMKMPFPGGSMLGWYAYQYMEDQLVLMALSNSGAMIQFIEDIAVDRQALVCMCWIALGI